MTRSLALISLLFTFNLRAGDSWELDLNNSAITAKKITLQLANPNLSPSASADLQRQKQSAVKNIETVGANTKTNPAAQLAVGRSLASIEEAPRAIPYAEKGLALAEASGDRKLLREALLTGAMVYEKAGQYELAKARARRVLKDNPKDKEALALYMMLKDRVSSSALPPASGGESRSAPQSAATMERAANTPAIAMTNASTLEALRHLAEGRRLMKLDVKAALRSFELAIAADAKSAAARVERARARLAAGDATGALEDAEAAASLDPRCADAYAARAEAKRALGRKEADALADYETAAKLDGRFTEAYKRALSQMGGSSPMTEGAENQNHGGASAPDGARGMFAQAAKDRRLRILIAIMIAALLIKLRSRRNQA